MLIPRTHSLNTHYMKTIKLCPTNLPKITVLSLLLLSSLLTACSVFSFSPETAAVSAVKESFDHQNALLDIDSLVILQSHRVSDYAVILLSYQSNHAGIGIYDCMSMYLVNKSRLGGWYAGSGGSACSSGRSAEEIPPIDVGGNRMGSSRPNDPGFSAVYGAVYQEDIANVQVIWNDDQLQEVPVVNASYLAFRDGEFDYQTIKALDADGQVVYEYTPQIAPGKMP